MNERSTVMYGSARAGSIPEPYTWPLPCHALEFSAPDLLNAIHLRYRYVVCVSRVSLRSASKQCTHSTRHVRAGRRVASCEAEAEAEHWRQSTWYDAERRRVGWCALGNRPARDAHQRAAIRYAARYALGTAASRSSQSCISSLLSSLPAPACSQLRLITTMQTQTPHQWRERRCARGEFASQVHTYASTVPKHHCTLYKYVHWYISLCALLMLRVECSSIIYCKFSARTFYRPRSRITRT